MHSCGATHTLVAAVGVPGHEGFHLLRAEGSSREGLVGQCKWGSIDWKGVVGGGGRWVVYVQVWGGGGCLSVVDSLLIAPPRNGGGRQNEEDDRPGPALE